MTLQRVLLGGFLLILIAAPLPFGSVQREVSAALVAACLALGAVWVVWRSRQGLTPLPWGDRVLAAGAVVALLGVVQLVPMPSPVLQTVSPQALELRDRYEPARQEGDAGWRPVSMYPWATRQSTLRIAAFLVTALIAIDLSVIGSARRAMVMALVASGAFQALYGLVEYFSGRQHIFGYAKKHYTDVATGTFINRNHYAGYLEMTLPLAIALAAGAVARLRPPAGGTLGDRLARASGREMFGASTLLALALVMATALACSRSRMGIASALLALMSVGLFLAWRGRGRSFVVTALVVAGGTFLIFSESGATAPILDRFHRAYGELTAGVGRWGIWSQAAGVARAFPLIGAGLGAFPAVFPMFRTAGEGVAFAHAHNDYLEWLAEAGVAGCLVALLAVAWVAWPLARRRAGRGDYGYVGHACVIASLAIGFHSFTDFNLAIPSNALTLSVLLGMTVAWLRVPAPSLAVPAAATRPWAARSVAPAGLLATVALLAAAPAVAAPIDNADPFNGGLGRLVDRGDADRLFEIARVRAEAAITDLQVLVEIQGDNDRATPDAAEYVEGRLRDAITIQTEGLRRRPTSANGQLMLARLQAGLCAARALRETDDGSRCIAAALPRLRAALELDPMSASIHAQAARFLAAAWPALGDADRAEIAPLLERARALNPDDRELREALVALRGTGEAQ